MEIVRGKKLKNKLSIIVISIIVGIVLLVMGIISYAKSNEEITTLSIFTKNGDSTVNLSGAKYTIKKVMQDKDGKEIEEEAKDFKGNLIGNIENINGTDYRVIESDKNGEINLDLKSGRYRVTEVQAPTGYKLNDNNTYEANLEAKGEYSIFCENREWEKEYEASDNASTFFVVLDIKESKDEEYLALVIVKADNYIIPAEEMENNKAKELQSGIHIIRYNANNKIKEVVWLNNKVVEKLKNVNTKVSQEEFELKLEIIQETDKNYVLGFNILENNDGESFSIGFLMYFSKDGTPEKISSENYDCIINTTDSIVNNNITTIGMVNGITIIPAEETSDNKEISVGIDGKLTKILIQFNEIGKVNWAINIGDIIQETNMIEKDNKIVVDIEVKEKTTIDENNTVSKEKIEVEPGKYQLIANNNGKIEEIRERKNPILIVDDEKIINYSNKLTSDGGNFISIRFSYDVDDNDCIINSEWTTKGEEIILERDEDYIIKLNSEEKVEWIRKFDTNDWNTGNLEIFEVNNGYIVTGSVDNIYIEDTTSKLPIDGIDFEEPIEAKLNKDGQIMYAKNVEKNEENDLKYWIKDVIRLENNKYVYLKGNYEIIENVSMQEKDKEPRPTTETLIFEKLEKYEEREEKREKIDKQIINITNKQEDSLQIIKKDSRTAQLLPGAKFTIKRINENNGNITKEDAIDKDGKLIGNIENINGKDLRVVTTNEKGEINESLPVGKYEIIEVKAPEGYYLKPTVEENTYEVEITEQQEEKKEWKEIWNRIVGRGRNIELRNIDLYEEYSNLSVLDVNESGVVVYLNTENINIPPEDTIDNKEINLNNPVIIKYNLDNKVEWVKNTIKIENIKRTNDGYILNGWCKEDTEISAEDTTNNKSFILEGGGSPTIKLDKNFNIVSFWAGDSAIIDNFYLLKIYKSKTLPEICNVKDEKIQLNEGTYVVKLNDQLKIEKISGNLGNIKSYYSEEGIYKLEDNRILYRRTQEKDEKVTVGNNKEFTLINGKEYLVDCDFNGKINNIFIGMDEIDEVTEDVDGYLLKVNNETSTKIPAEYTNNGKEITINDYMYIKLDQNFKLINKTISAEKRDYSESLSLMNIEENGYILKIFSNNAITIPKSNTTNNIDINLNDLTENIIKFDKDLKVIEVINELQFDPRSYSLSDFEGKYDDIYVIDINVGKYPITIQSKYTVRNEEINLSNNTYKIIYNSDFKVIGACTGELEYNLKEGIVFKEENNYERIIPSTETESGKEIKLKSGKSYILYNKNDMKVKQVLTGYKLDSDYSIEIDNALYLENEDGEEFVIKAEDTEDNETITIEANSNYIVFVNMDTFKIKSIMYTSDSVYNIEKNDDGYILDGRFYEDKIILGKYTESGKDIKLPQWEEWSNYTIKYNEQGKIQCIVKGDFVKLEKKNETYKFLLKDKSKNRDEINNNDAYKLIILDSNWNTIKEINDFLLETSDGGYIYNKEYITNTTITKENNTIGEDIFVNKGRYLVKENKEGKIEWLVKEQYFIKELTEINNTYFGGTLIYTTYSQFKIELNRISEETIKEQLTNKKVINITNESDVGKIVTKYVDKATNKEIAVSEEITDRVGADYETKAKEIEYYKLEGTPENAKGKVTNGTTEVIYYYNKQDFNIKADKTISELYVNGEKQDVKNNKNNIFQVSINRKEVTKTDLKIRYIIRISNTGEIPGTAGKVTDQIPEGLEFYQEDNPDYWKLENGVAITDKLDNKVILPGQFEELEIILRCSNLEDKLGVKTNHVVAENMNNEPNFEDTNKEDDKGKCDLIVSIGLGGTDIIAILGVSTISLIVVAKVINKFRKRSK